MNSAGLIKNANLRFNRSTSQLLLSAPTVVAGPLGDWNVSNCNPNYVDHQHELVRFQNLHSPVML
jgi:hypothetical protein